MKRLCMLLLSLLLLLLPCAALADGLVLTAHERSLDYAFAANDSFVVLKYTAPTESGWMTLYNENGIFSGTLALPLSESGGKVKVTVESLAQRALLSGDAVLPAAENIVQPTGSAKPSGKIRDLALEETPEGLHYTFTAPGADYLTLNYKSKQQSGTYVIYPSNDKGLYEGDLALPLTYARTVVTLRILSGNGKNELIKAQARKGWAMPEAAGQNPEGRLKGVTVCVDAGHQENGQIVTEPNGPGLSGTTRSTGGMAQGKATMRKEHIVTLEIAYMLRDELLRQGANVVMTRTEVGPFISNLDRCAIAEEGGADIMLRLHCDNREGSPNKRGISVQTPLKSDYARAIGNADEWRAMANLMLDAMRTAVGYELTDKTGSVRLSDQYIGNNWAKMPCFLVEMGFMSNMQEDVLMSHPVYQQWLAEGMAQGVYDIAVHRGLISGE